MKKSTGKFFACVFAFWLAVSFAFAEPVSGFSNLASINGIIAGTVDTNLSFTLQVNMPIPPDNSSKIKQYKMQNRSMSKKDVQDLLVGKVLTDVPDAEWVYNDSDTSESLFLFQENNLKYTWIFRRICRMPLDKDTASPSLVKADETVRSVLDSLNVTYEYPFYTCTEAYKTMNTKLFPVKLENLDDVKRLFLKGCSKEGKYNYDLTESYHGFDDEYVLVIARMQLNGIPFAYSDIVSPSYQESNPVYDNASVLMFQLTHDGKITYAKAGNIQDVVKSADENRPILSWQECLKSLCAKDSRGQFKNVESAMLVDCELCYAVNNKHITYPVWQFTIEIHYDGTDEVPDAAYPCPFYVDAITGQILQ